MECLLCARGECRYGERCMRSQRPRTMRQSRLDSDYESGSGGGSGGGGGGSTSAEEDDGDEVRSVGEGRSNASGGANAGELKEAGNW